MVPRTCIECGEVFLLSIGESKRTGKRYHRFCSRRCSKRGAANPKWKGDAASKTAGNYRARNRYAATKCQRCGAPRAELHHKDENTLNNSPDNIQILCRRCHMQLDGRLAILQANSSHAGTKGSFTAAANRKHKTHCIHGHEYTADNTKMTGRGSRICRTCARAAGRKYWRNRKKRASQP